MNIIRRLANKRLRGRHGASKEVTSGIRSESVDSRTRGMDHPPATMPPVARLLPAITQLMNQSEQSSEIVRAVAKKEIAFQEKSNKLRSNAESSGRNSRKNRSISFSKNKHESFKTSRKNGPNDDMFPVPSSPQGSDSTIESPWYYTGHSRKPSQSAFMKRVESPNQNIPHLDNQILGKSLFERARKYSEPIPRLDRKSRPFTDTPCPGFGHQNSAQSCAPELIQAL